MKTTLFALTLMLCCSSISIAQVAAPAGNSEARKYAKDFQGQDLSRQKFLNEKLDNCNFEDCNLTEVDFTVHR